MEETSQAEPVLSGEESQQLCHASESEAPANGDCPVPAKSKRVIQSLEGVWTKRLRPRKTVEDDVPKGGEI